MILISKDTFQMEVTESAVPVLLDFWAAWCGPCQRLAPIVDELATEYEGKAVIGKYNVDEGEDLVAQYGIRNIPVLLFLKNGEMVHKMVGAATKAQVQENIEKFL